MRSVSVQAEEPWPYYAHEHPLAISGQQQARLREDFDRLASDLCGQLLPELHGKREALASATQHLDSQRAELRRRCAEAEREGREEFEALRGHLASVESLKVGVLDRERSLREELVQGIDEVAQNIQRARVGFHGIEEMADFLRMAPDLRAAAETLRSRASALPRVEVPMDDVPYEARAREERLRQLAVTQHLLQAKDVALWRMEQQRRRFAQERQDVLAWANQLELLLDRYSEELAFGCYFCSEMFSAGAANTRCAYNVGSSPRSGRPLAPDPRVPAHLWGTGAHYWVPQSAVQPGLQGQPQSAAMDPPAQQLPQAQVPQAQVPQAQLLPTQQILQQSQAPCRAHWPSPDFLAEEEQFRPSQPSQVPSRAHWPSPDLLAEEEQFRAFVRNYAGPPTPSAASLSPRAPLYPPSRQWEQPSWQRRGVGTHLAAAATTDVHLRHIAQLCEQRGVDARNAFRAFDANGDGLVSPQEFVYAIAKLGLNLSAEEAANLLARLDVNADGMVSYEEFLASLFRAVRDPATARIGPALAEHLGAKDIAATTLWQRVSRAFQDRGVPLRQVFALFDADGDGVISRQELMEAFRLMQLGLNDDDVERMMRDIDINRDGRVNIHEFINRLQM